MNNLMHAVVGALLIVGGCGRVSQATTPEVAPVVEPLPTAVTKTPDEEQALEAEIESELRDVDIPSATSAGGAGQ